MNSMRELVKARTESWAASVYAPAKSASGADDEVLVKLQAIFRGGESFGCRTGAVKRVVEAYLGREIGSVGRVNVPALVAVVVDGKGTRVASFGCKNNKPYRLLPNGGVGDPIDGTVAKIRPATAEEIDAFFDEVEKAKPELMLA